MRLSKESQYALLFTMYLSRAGRATVGTSSINLNLSPHFLHQIARKLKIEKIVKSTRGPGGGYSLEDNIRIIDVLNVFDHNGLLDSEDRQKYATSGVVEERSLEHFISNLGMAMWPILNQTVQSWVERLVQNEMLSMEALGEDKGIFQ